MSFGSDTGSIRTGNDSPVIKLRPNVPVMIGAGVALAIVTATVSIAWPAAAVAAHLVWLAISFALVIGVPRARTSDLSGWRRATAWTFLTLVIMGAYVFAYGILLIEYGTKVLGWRP